MISRLTASAAGALAFALVSGSAALAADFDRPAPIAVQVGTSQLGVSDVWSGMYAGIHAGRSTSAGVVTAFGRDGAWEGGVHVGGNMQFGALVVGAEVEGNYTSGLSYDLGGGAGLKQNWGGAARARAGLALDNLLLYGTVGYGFARLDPTGSVISDGKYVGGLTLGGGAEFMVSDGLSLRLDYAQTRFEDVAFTTAGGAQTRDLTSHAVRAGVSFRF
jgi:outer membrane immunogenic protein